MCLLALAIGQSRRFPLVVAANRDERFDRATAALGWWSPGAGAPAVLSGRDLESGGTWMGLSAAGRLALLTNVRGAKRHDAAAPSRGAIVTGWLAAREAHGDFWTRTAASGHNGFNLIAADFRRDECFWASNIDARTQPLGPGLYGLSNGSLDTPWPKVDALKRAMHSAIGSAPSADELAARLFATLADPTPAADDRLPDTGIPIERERQLSPAFIRIPDRGYGTRCTTLLVTERHAGRVVTHVIERSFGADGAVAGTRRTGLRDWPPRSPTARDAARSRVAVSEQA